MLRAKRAFCRRFIIWVNSRCLTHLKFFETAMIQMLSGDEVQAMRKCNYWLAEMDIRLEFASRHLRGYPATLFFSSNGLRLINERRSQRLRSCLKGTCSKLTNKFVATSAYMTTNYLPDSLSDSIEGSSPPISSARPLEILRRSKDNRQRCRHMEDNRRIHRGDHLVSPSRIFATKPSQASYFTTPIGKPDERGRQRLSRSYRLYNPRAAGNIQKNCTPNEISDPES